MMSAARALKAAGHRPVVVGPTDLTAQIPDDVEVLTVGGSDLPPGYLTNMCQCLSQMSSFADVRQMFRLIEALSQFYVDHLPAAAEKLGADAILHDQLEPAAGLVARGLSRSLRICHISLACALPMNRDASVPPPLMGWRYRPDRFGHWLNGGYYNVVNWLLAGQGRVLQSAADRFGLSKSGELLDWQRPWSVDDGISRHADLSQGLASLDYPRDRPPRYLGPLRDAGSTFPGLDSIAAERDGRSLAFLSLGTLMGERTSILSAMAKAATAQGLQPVIVHGGRIGPRDLDVPVGTIIRDFLDQSNILSDSKVAMIHGGYNTTTDAVAAGVPLVTVPLVFEQGAIAARIERAGVGRTVNRLGPNLSQRLTFALGHVLTSESVQHAVRRTQFEALAAPGLAGLVSEVEACLGHKNATARHISSVQKPVSIQPVPSFWPGYPAE